MCLFEVRQGGFRFDILLDEDGSLGFYQIYKDFVYFYKKFYFCYIYSRKKLKRKRYDRLYLENYLVKIIYR